VEERRAALAGCFQLDRVEDGASSAEASRGSGQDDSGDGGSGDGGSGDGGSGDGGSGDGAFKTQPVGMWAWNWLGELCGDIIIEGVGGGYTSEPSRAADWRAPLKDVLTRGGAPGGASGGEGLERAIDELDCLLAAGVVSLEFVPQPLSNEALDDGGGGSRQWQTLVVVSPLAMAAYKTLSREPHAISIMEARQHAVYHTEDRNFLLEDVREIDEYCAVYAQWEAAWANEMLLLFEGKQPTAVGNGEADELEKAALKRKARGAVLVLDREEKRRSLGARCKLLLKRAEELQMSHVLPTEHMCRALVEEGLA
jgi:hypothetical protein